MKSAQFHSYIDFVTPFSNNKIAPEYFKYNSVNLKEKTLAICKLCIQNLQNLSYVKQGMEETHLK